MRKFLVFIFFIFPGMVMGFERNCEPVVLTGASFSEFIGDSVKHLFVYSYNGGWQQIPSQIDEKSASGSYFEPDDDLLDENDELCLMAGDGGDTTSNWLPQTLDKRYKIRITNPLTGEEIFAYLYYSTQLPHDTIDYVNYTDTLTNCINAWGYIIDHVDGNPAVTELVKITPENGGSNEDLIDRNKIRVFVDMPRPLPDTLLTENEQGPNMHFDGFIDGRVRVITSTWNEFLSLRVATSISSYYKSMYISIAITHGNMSGDIAWMRASIDFNHNLSGLVHYDNGGPSGNGPIYIDGSPDSYDSLPMGTWGEIDHPTAGCAVIVSDTQDMPGSVRLFYQDGGTDPSGIETGENGIWGESGIFAENISGSDSTYNEQWTFLLPANQGNVGDQYASYYNNPLVVACSLEHYGVEMNEDVYTRGFIKCSPNPCCYFTTIRFQPLGELRILDNSGRVIQIFPKCNSPVVWNLRKDNGEKLGAGIYFAELRSSKRRIVEKIVLIGH